MFLLILGLLVFMIPHSLPMIARSWRDAKKIEMGSKVYEGIYSLVSLLGLILIVYGYGITRSDPVFIWQPPPGMRHATVAFTLVAFIILSAAYVPGNHLKAKFGHPMVLGVKVWAFAHLLSNGRLGDMVLFGVFLAWSILYFRNARAHDRQNFSIAPANATVGGTVLTVIVGLVLWAGFGLLLHTRLIGVSPFG